MTYNLTPEHLAAIILQARRSTALHRRNVGIYGNSAKAMTGDSTNGWLEVRDYLKETAPRRWSYNINKPSQYRRVMREAERFVKVYCERIVAQRVIEILNEHIMIATARYNKRNETKN